MVSSDPDEKALAERAQRDPRRFADLYALHFDRVYAFVARRVATRSVAQDLTSDVFQDTLAAWVCRIAANAVADHYQRSAREQQAPPDPESPDADALTVERRALIYRAVRTLPDDQRRVIELRFADEQSIAETARVLGRSE